MQAISRMCADEGLLAALLFFSGCAVGLNMEKHLTATIAHQIPLSIPETRRYIAQAIESDPSVSRASLETQITPLVCNCFDPLLSL